LVWWRVGYLSFGAAAPATRIEALRAGLKPSSTEVGAAKQATKTIPIVFATHADPVGTGHVTSLARPGGNVTGLSVLLSELTAKALEILKEVVPKAKRFGVLSSPTVPSHVP
jgi:putative tryptophan/tyrosine transport system substrate-binding protein